MMKNRAVREEKRLLKILEVSWSRSRKKTSKTTIECQMGRIKMGTRGKHQAIGELRQKQYLLCQ
jgi:hypothetical protein